MQIVFCQAECLLSCRLFSVHCQVECLLSCTMFSAKLSVFCHADCFLRSGVFCHAYCFLPCTIFLPAARRKAERNLHAKEILLERTAEQITFFMQIVSAIQSIFCQIVFCLTHCFLFSLLSEVRIYKRF